MKKAEAKQVKVRYRYVQAALVACTGTIEVPTSILKKGKATVHEYIREHEVDAANVDENIIDWCYEVEGSMTYER